jgi:hypothetical protein
MPAKAPVIGNSPTKAKTATPTSRIGNAHEVVDLRSLILGKCLQLHKTLPVEAEAAEALS